MCTANRNQWARVRSVQCWPNTNCMKQMEMVSAISIYALYKCMFTCSISLHILWWKINMVKAVCRMLNVALVFNVGKKYTLFYLFNNEWFCMIVEHYNHECNRCNLIFFIWHSNHWWRWGVNLPPGWTPEDEKLPGSGPPPAPHPEDGLNSCQKLRDYHGNQGARTQNNHMTWEPLPFWGRRWEWCQKHTSKVKI